MDFEQIVRWYFAGDKAEACWILAAGIASLVAVMLLLLAALGLTIDFFAERRAEQYREALRAVGALPA